jgi:opacity protein-like surface antigen
MRSLALGLGIGLAALGSPQAAAATGDTVGSATKVVNRVTAEFQSSAHDLATGDGVRQDETIAVEANGLGEIKLNDDTKLALGPGARLKLDKFVYDPDKTNGAISVDLLKGAFRFVTGKAAKPNYLIRSPNASISIRGTIFDVYVDAAGYMWILLHAGSLEACNAAKVCRVLSNPCSVLRVGADGSVGEPGTLDRQPRPLDTEFEIAFPFIATPPDFDPVLRFTRASLETGSCSGQQDQGPKLQRADVVPDYNPPASPRSPSTPSTENDDPPATADATPESTDPLPTIPGAGIPIYIRIDVSANVTSNPPAVREEGLVLGDRPEVIGRATVSEPIPLSQDWISEEFDGRGSFGVGIGLRLPGGFRIEGTVDRRHETAVSVEGSDVTDIRTPPIAFPAATDLYASTSERTEIGGALFMANGYFDIPISGPLKAYVGGGLGVAWTEFERENSTLMSAFGTGPGRRVLYEKTVRETDHDVSLAAAAAFGFSYVLSKEVELDVGYRYTHIEGASGDLDIAGHTSTLSIGDEDQHEVRFGVRLSPF